MTEDRRRTERNVTRIFVEDNMEDKYGLTDMNDLPGVEDRNHMVSNEYNLQGVKIKTSKTLSEEDKLRHEMLESERSQTDGSEGDLSSLELKIQFSEESESESIADIKDTMIFSTMPLQSSLPLTWQMTRKSSSFRNFKQGQHLISWGPRTQLFWKYPPGQQEFYVQNMYETKKKRKKKKWTIMFCKFTCFLFLICIFLLSLIFVSLFISQGKKMFGSI